MLSIEKYSAKYNNLILRERLIILIALLMCMYFMFAWLFVQPLITSTKQLQLENNYLNSLKSDVADGGGEQSQAYDKGYDELVIKRDTLKKEYENINDEQRLHTISSSNDVISIVEGLVKEMKSITLARIEVLPLEDIQVHREEENHSVVMGSRKDVNNNSDLNEKENTIFKHRIYLELTGRYMDLTKYLQQIELLDWQLFIENIHFKVENYPVARISIVFYSFSLGGDRDEI